MSSFLHEVRPALVEELVEVVEPAAGEGGGGLRIVVLAGGALAANVGELKELAPGVREAAGLEHGACVATVAVQLAVAAIGVGLK